MSTTIHYRGRFKAGASLEDMIEIVQNVCEVHEWEYRVYERFFPQQGVNEAVSDHTVFGMTFRPPSSEYVWLCFRSDGNLCEVMPPNSTKYVRRSSDDIEAESTSTVSTKTHFAGKQVHAIIIRLFKFLRDKYFEDFELIDEAQYWETDDLELLEKNFHVMDMAFEFPGFALENVLDSEDESVEEHFNRVLGPHRNN